MLDQERLADAIVVQRRCFALLRWLRGAIERGTVRLDTAHEYMSASEAATEWILRHYQNLPQECRPSATAGRQLDWFASYFASYLLTSYEVDPKPPTHTVFVCDCGCPMCNVIVRAPYLKPRRVTREDKKKAESLKRTVVAELAARAGQPLERADADRILRLGSNSESAAYVAYAVQLLRRCEGSPSGPESLALWRQFAWNAKGSPKRQFELTMESVLIAERQLMEAITLAA